MTVAKFCPGCGHETLGAAYCSQCGASTMLAAAAAAAQRSAAPIDEEERELWSGSPDPMLDALAARSTRYVLTTERLRVQTGLIGKRSEQLDLFRVKDVVVHRGMLQRARGCGDVVVSSTDASTPKLLLAGVKDPEQLAETIRTASRNARRHAGVRMEEQL